MIRLENYSKDRMMPLVLEHIRVLLRMVLYSRISLKNCLREAAWRFGQVCLDAEPQLRSSQCAFLLVESSLGLEWLSMPDFSDLLSEFRYFHSFCT